MSRLLRMSYLVAAVAGVGFFVMSILLLGVWPGRTLEQQIRVRKRDARDVHFAVEQIPQ